MAIIFAMRRPPDPPRPPGPYDDEWWDGYFDDDYWEADDPGVWGEWEEGTQRWVPSESEPYEVDLLPKEGTTWRDDYRPTSIRYTVDNDPGDLYLYLYASIMAGTLASGYLSPSGEIEFGAMWQYEGIGDIDVFYLYSDEGTEWDGITKIEFYKDTVTDWNQYEGYRLSLYGGESTFLNQADFKTGEELTLLEVTEDINNMQFYKQLEDDSLIDPASYDMRVTNLEFYEGGSWQSRWGNTWWTINNNAEWDEGDLLTDPFVGDGDAVTLSAAGPLWEDYRPTQLRYTYTLHYAARM